MQTPRDRRAAWLGAVAITEATTDDRKVKRECQAILERQQARDQRRSDRITLNHLRTVTRSTPVMIGTRKVKMEVGPDDLKRLNLPEEALGGTIFHDQPVYEIRIEGASRLPQLPPAQMKVYSRRLKLRLERWGRNRTAA